MSTTAWSALADRFRALAGEQEFCFRTYPSDSRQPFLDDEGRFRFVYPFGNAPGTLQHYGVVIGDGTATGEEFARVNRFRWLAWAAGLLLRPDPHTPAELHWWRHVLGQRGRKRGKTRPRSTLGNLASASEAVARRFAGGAALPLRQSGTRDQSDNWPRFREAFRTLRERFNDQRWHTARPNAALFAFPDPNGYEVWRRRDFDRVADLQIGENRSWACRGSVWGYTEEVEAFVGLAEDAGTTLPLDLTFTPALFPYTNPLSHLRVAGVGAWLEFLFALNPTAFTHEHNWPARGSRIARLTVNPFTLSATTLARLLDAGPSAVVSDFYAGVALLNPWLDGDDQAAAVAAVAAAGNSVTALAPLPPAPVEKQWTFGDLVGYVGSVERAAADTRAEADALGGAPGTGYWRITAALMEADALHKKHPAFPALEGYVNYHHGEFTYANLVRVRGELCRSRGCGTDEVNAIPLEQIPSILGWPTANPTPPAVVASAVAADTHLAADAPYTLKDIRELIRYRQADAKFRAQLGAMTPQQIAIASLGRAMNLPMALTVAQWSALNCPQPPRLTEDEAVMLPTYHWLVAAARAEYQTTLDEETFQLLVGIVAMRSGGHVADLVSLPLLEFEAVRTTGVVPNPQPAIEPPAATDDEPRLGDTARALLLELHTARAFGRPTLATLSELAPKLGKGRTAEDLKRPSAELGRAKLVDSQSGRGGGVWLTAAGKRYAEDLLRADGQLPPDGNGDKR